MFCASYKPLAMVCLTSRCSVWRSWYPYDGRDCHNPVYSKVGIGSYKFILYKSRQNKDELDLRCRFRRNLVQENYVSSLVLERVSIYRHIEVIASICNKIQQRTQLPTIIAGSIVTLGVSLAFLVQTPATPDNASLLVLMLLASVNTTFFLLFCLGSLAQVYKESVAALESIRLQLPKVSEVNERRWLRKFIRSCAVIKMKFGGNNFVEELTPLNCISHAIDLSVQILLLGRDQ